MISHTETLLKVGSKFQVFISYSFHVIFFTEIVKEGAVDPLNGWVFKQLAVNVLKVSTEKFSLSSFLVSCFYKLPVVIQEAFSELNFD